jgi:hypothetical protein
VITKGLRNYGIPYMGSKSAIVRDLLKVIPSADNFYDLFGGGFCVTHCALEMFSHKWKNLYFNEIKSDVSELIKDAIAGKYNYENFKPEFITREKFFKNKDTCAYTRLIWSFGNNQKDYLFGKEIESQKRSMHMAVVFDEFDKFMVETFDLKKWPNDLDITGKRLYLKRVLAKKKQRVDLEQLERLQRLEQLEQLERLQQLQLQQLQQLQRLQITSLDYSKVKIKKNSVIYCDIPYQNTTNYLQEFDYERFFDWAAKHPMPVFISEFEIKDPRFSVVFEKPRPQRLAANSKNGKRKVFIEKLYANKQALELINNFKLEISA